MVDVFIKNVDAKAYRAAKIIAAREDKRIGEVISESILLLASQPKKKGLAGIKPFSFGPGNERLSMQVDEILAEDY